MRNRMKEEELEATSLSINYLKFFHLIEPRTCDLPWGTHLYQSSTLTHFYTLGTYTTLRGTGICPLGIECTCNLEMSAWVPQTKYGHLEVKFYLANDILCL